MHNQQIVSLSILAVLFIGLFAWRMRRMMTATPYNPYRAWMLPLVFIVLVGLSIWHAMPMPIMDWVWIALAALVGAGFGWLRGKSISMTYDAAKGQLFARGGAMAMIFIVALIVVRTGFKLYLQQNGASVGINPSAADAIFSAIGAGLFIARSVEMGLRGHSIIVANRGVSATPVVDAL